MAGMVGLIPAAGRGIRAYPYTESVPKCLLEVDGVPLLRRNIELMRDQLGIRDVFVVVGHRGERIREYLGDGSGLGVRARYIQNDRLDLDLAWSVALAARVISDPCCMVLSDECYIDSNHRDLLDFPYDSALATCGLVEAESSQQVRGNYAVWTDANRIVALEEKPETVRSPWMGAGTYMLHPEALRRLAADFAAAPDSPIVWTEWLGELARSGERVLAFPLKGAYVNVNDREALNLANHLVRDRDFESRTASLVYVVDDAEDAVEEPVLRFAAAPELAEVVVAARRPASALDLVARHPKVRVHVNGDPKLPLGTLVREGLDAATGDILLTAYSDDSFSVRDLPKLLVYLRDADLVVGTRTTRQMIDQGSNMRGIVRTAHVALAKLMELLWWRFDCRFTDVCCVYRAFWRSTYTLIRGELRSTGVELFPEMVIEVLRARRRIIEIPVNYSTRDREHEYVPSKYQNVGTFLRILWVILRKRFSPGASSALGRARAAEVGGNA
jgi:NDP-sugar pyrophosphorylase family protein